MIKLIDADHATRSFYSREGIKLGPQVAPPINDHPVPLERTPPPYSGFGSEEDSLTSCAGSLVQKAPARQHGEDGILRYQAAFAHPKLMIREPPRRNSGVVGGNFIVIGATLTLASHTFVILDADEATLKYMEDRPNQFPFSDWHSVLALAEAHAESTLCKPKARTAILRSDVVDFGKFESILTGIFPVYLKDVPVLFRSAT